MQPRERFLAALNHREADHVPLELGSTQVTGIHAVAYRALRKSLGLPDIEIRLCDYIQGLALLDDDFIRLWGVDARGLFPLNSHNWKVLEEDSGDYWTYHDEWGIVHRRPKPAGLYYSVFRVPFEKADLSIGDIEGHRWPEMGDRQRIAGLHQLAEAYRAEGYAVVLKDPFAGLFEMSQRLVGMENLLVMMAAARDVVGVLFERLLRLKLDFWEMALPELRDVVDVVTVADDYGTQSSQLISPRMFRQQVKPHLKRLLERLKVLAPEAKRFFHSCGNVRPIIPDFIEIGVDILNPVHTRAEGMDPLALKREFGRDLVFWGGGVDTQGVLPYGTPQDVWEDVRRNIRTLAPGGGYVFNTVHNVQADVPPENLIAMWDAWRESGAY